MQSLCDKDLAKPPPLAVKHLVLDLHNSLTPQSTPTLVLHPTQV